MRILVTGFEPFGPHDVNPSEQIIRKLEERKKWPRSVELITAILPTEFSAAGNQVQRLIRHFQPAAVLCLGLAASRTTISLERVALNLDDDALPDNAGRLRTGRLIVRDGPAAYWSTLPLQRLHRALKQRGIAASVSNHAGTYVCNHVFYVALHEIDKVGRVTPCGFIHVPKMTTAGKKRKSSAGLLLNDMVRAVECCLSIVCRDLSRALDS